MVVRQWFVFVMLFSANLFANAQLENDVELTWSPITKQSFTVHQFLRTSSPPYFLEAQKGNGLFKKPLLLRLDSSLAWRKKLKIQPSYEQIPLEYDFTAVYRNQPMVFSHFNNRGHNASYLFAQPIERTSFKLGSPLKKVGQAPFINQRKSASFEVVKSKNQNFLLVYSRLMHSEAKGGVLQFSVFDKELNNVFSNKEMTGGAVESATMIEMAQINDSGTVFFVVVEERKSHRLLRAENTSSRWLYVFEKGKDLVRVKLQLQDNFIESLTLGFYEGSPKFLGFYSNEGKGALDGVFTLTFDKGFSNPPVEVSSPFSIALRESAEVLKQNNLFAPRRIENDDIEDFENYELDYMITEDDGTSFLIAEYAEFYSTAMFDGSGNEQIINHYVYEHILVSCIDADGDLEWAALIPKFQYTMDDGGYYSSYAVTSSEDELYFFFNDSHKNYDESSGVLLPLEDGFSPFMRSDRSVFAGVRVSKVTGEIEHKALFSTRDVGVMLKPRVSLHLPSSDVILYGNRGRKSRFVKIQVKND